MQRADDIDDIDWDDLRYFLAAARAKTLAGAARLIGVEHTTVGRRLSALERSLGAALVLRGSDGLRLTRLGERLAPRVEELERAVLMMRELAKSQATVVRLTVPSGIARFFTAELPELCRDHPGITLEISSGAKVADLNAGEADLAVRSGPIADRELVARKLCESGFSLYASQSYLARRGPPRDLDDLRGHELIAYHESFANVPAARWIESRASGAKVVLRSREMTDMLAAAAQGVGLALLPCSLADAEPLLTRLTTDVLAMRTLWLVQRREARLSREVRAVSRFVVQVIKQHSAEIEGKGRATP
jgi:DNA-binding transcriptional LysR family regulator